MIPAALLDAVLVNAFAALLALLFQAVRLSGAIVGTLVGIAVYLGATLSGWILLSLFFVIGSVATRIGIDKKRSIGTEQPHEGKRGAAEAAAKAGFPFLLSLMMLQWEFDWLPLAFCGAIAAATADTLGSEVGPLTGGTVRKLPLLQRVPPGTPGGISFGGTIAACAGSMTIALAAIGWIGYESIVPITFAGLLASMIDGIIASRFSTGKLSHHLGNFVSCGSGSALAVLLNSIIETGRNT
jgi:uncharacterized protein (TIGR00297 family)